MILPSINTIRESLALIKGALIDEPWTSTVDLGDMPHVPIHQPMEPKHDEGLAADTSIDEEPSIPDEEPSIIFEIPPELDDRILNEASGGAFTRRRHWTPRREFAAC